MNGTAPTRRDVLATSIAAGAVELLPKHLAAATADRSIQPFTVNVPEAAVDDLRRRIAATRWPTKELVEDRSQGVQLATLQELARYWTTEYDWRKCRSEAERAAAVHDRDRRGGDPLHPRQVAA